MRFSAEFTRHLGAAGFIGMTWPKEYGGAERSAFDRYIVTEELLAVGAPVRGHWVSDRQTGPVLLKFGTPEQKRKYLPAMARGEHFFALGLSEPDAGSDLSAMRTKADKVEGGWLVSGTKVWTTNAHNSQSLLVFCRTSPPTEDRHHGFSQLIVPIPTPGLTIRPIINIAGEHDFNEITLDNVFVPEENLVGTLGNGWGQVNAELAYERSGPERWMSAYRLLAELSAVRPKNRSDAWDSALGRLYSHLLTLRQMSISVAAMLEAGQSPMLEAAIVKDLGTCFEQDLVQVAADLVHVEGLTAEDAPNLFEVLGHGRMWSVAFTIRGGAKEIMRGVVARGMGLR
jgi:alkylation response protein AidB-like acyl-CoA dehydrogenase